MRIVQFVETLEVGGLERMAVDLARSQAARGHSVAVYCLFHAGPLRTELEAAGIPVVELHKERRSKAALVWALTRQLRRDRPDVLQGHNPGVHHFAAVAKRLAGVPVCLSTRHAAHSSDGSPYQERYFRWVEPLTDHVVFVCDYARAILGPKLGYPAEKCSLILNGIALDAFLRRPASPGAAAPRLRFGTIGRMVPAKGHAILVEAFARIAAEFPTAELRIHGYGPLEDELRGHIRRAGMEGRILLPGRTGDPSAALADLDVFVFSSVNEGLPLVILEAMAAGLPIVSTRVGGVPEVAPEEEVAWYAEPKDVEGLALAMRQAARAAGELPRRGARARAIAASRYGIDAMADAYDRLYRKLLAVR